MIGKALDRNQVLGTQAADFAFRVADAVLGRHGRADAILGG